MHKRRFSAETIAALCVICFGAVFAYIGHGYPQGSLLRPGPGFMPFYIGLLMMLLAGLTLLENAPASTNSDDDAPASLRPILAISVAVVILALLLERLGFVPAVLAMFLCLGFAERLQSWLTLLGVCAFMLVLGVVLFIWGLGVPIPIIGAS